MLKRAEQAASDRRARACWRRPSRGVGAISAHLRRAIETGAYGEGDQLPPERELAATFRAARSTVRRALDQLERAGLVSRRLGSGTFVTAAGRDAATPATVADLISPLQLIEARFAVEPYTTRLAVLNATRRDLDDMEAALARAEALRRRQGRVLQVGCGVPPSDRARLAQPAARQCSTSRSTRCACTRSGTR